MRIVIELPDDAVSFEQDRHLDYQNLVQTNRRLTQQLDEAHVEIGVKNTDIIWLKDRVGQLERLLAPVKIVKPTPTEVQGDAYHAMTLGDDLPDLNGCVPPGIWRMSLEQVNRLQRHTLVQYLGGHITKYNDYFIVKIPENMPPTGNLTAYLKSKGL